jgi:anti-sigma regulatory factor (Ser/Thr protein kinase)
VIAQAMLRVAHESDVSEARRMAARLSADAGLSAPRASDVAIVATELAANLFRHAKKGELVLHGLRVDGAPQVEILSVDHGPGMADVERCLSDGYSTRGTLGAGLGGVRRIADTFDIYSRPDWGTVLLARVGDAGEPAAASRFEWGCISLPVQQETVCGDAWHVQVRDSVFSAMVADGLGHGPLAAEAARAAERVFVQDVYSEPKDYLEQAHRALGSTRGAAISVARASASDQRVVFAGVGNVAGAIVGAQEHRGMAGHNGTVGAGLHRVQNFEYEWPERALIVLHSDGLRTRWNLRDYPGLHARHPSVVAATLYKDFRRPNDDVTVLVGRRAS